MGVVCGWIIVLGALVQGRLPPQHWSRGVSLLGLIFSVAVCHFHINRLFRRVAAEGTFVSWPMAVGCYLRGLLPLGCAVLGASCLVGFTNEIDGPISAGRTFGIGIGFLIVSVIGTCYLPLVRKNPNKEFATSKPSVIWILVTPLFALCLSLAYSITLKEPAHSGKPADASSSNVVPPSGERSSAESGSH